MRALALLPIAVGRWLIILLACCACAFALDPSLDISQYSHAAWSIQDGSLPGAVRAITQTPDGYLWLGTEFGLTRFDGVRFVPWAPPSGRHLPSTNIRSLLAARDGTLWIGTLEGLASWKDGTLNEYAEFAGQNVLTLLQDSEGTVWAGTFQVPRAKLCAIQSGKVQCYGQDGSFGEWVYSLYEDHEHRLWIGSETGLWRWKPGPPKRYLMPHPIETAQAVVESDDGAGLLAVGEGISQFVNETIQEYQMASPPGRFMPVNMFRDRDGGLWIGTLQRGLLHVHEGRTSVFGRGDGLSSDRVLCFFEDPEGDVWVGTSEGLDRFRQTSVFSISEKQGLSAPSVVAVLAARDNSVWLSSLDGLNRWKNGQVTIYWPGGHGTKESTQETKSAFYTTDKKKEVSEVVDPALPDTTVGSLYEDHRGRIWVSTPKGIARFENGRFSKVKGVTGGWVNAITGDANEGVWLSYENLGLVHSVDDKIVDRVPWSRFGGNVVAASVIADPGRGGLWLGFFQGGLVHFKDGEIRASYGKSQGLGGGRVRSVQLDADGTLWAATEGGLSRLKDGHVLTLTSSNGLPCETIHWVVEADASSWLYTACGLVHVARSELDRWAANPKASIQFAVFDRVDGVRSRALLTGYTPLVSKSADGRLWFTNLDALSVIDPHHLTFNQTAPPVRIEQLIVDGRSYLPRRGVPRGEVRLPARVRDLTINYTALSLAAPEKIRFRYKLEGQDPDWREVVNKREVQYSNLRPGNYHFRVIACNNSGVWNQQGDTLDFFMAPAYYQTSWFAVLCTIVFLAIIWMLHQVRLHQLAGQFNRTLEARVGERTRIARELHDTLLQSFHGLLACFQSVSQLLPDRPIDAKQRIDRTIEQAAEAITEARQAVQGLRASTFITNELALALRTLGQELGDNEANSNDLYFGVEVVGTARELHPIVRDEVYRIGAEALRNAFSHAHARQIEVEIRYEDCGLVLCIHDDGKGIDPQVLTGEGQPGHYGLRGMRERAKLVGGKLEVWSERDAGTEIELSVPAANVYKDLAERGWWLQRISRKGKKEEINIGS